MSIIWHTNSSQPSELAVINSNFGNETLRAIPSPTAAYVLAQLDQDLLLKDGFSKSSSPVAKMLLERKSEHSDLPHSVDLAFPHS
jgi:hypothetical protein